MEQTLETAFNLPEKHCEIVTFATKPYKERFENSFSLKHTNGKKYIVMNMNLDRYKEFLESRNVFGLSVLKMNSGECYIVDSIVPHEYFK